MPDQSLLAAALRSSPARAASGLLSRRKPLYIDLQSGMLAAGTPLAAWADNASSNPGITLADSKSKCIRWNNNATQTAVWYEHPIPADLDEAADLVFYAHVSKSGATDADDSGLTLAAFFQVAGALHDADADCGGNTSAVVGTATAKTITEVSFTIPAADVLQGPGKLSFSVKPFALGTDDFMCHAMWFEYQPRLLAA